MAKAVVQEMFVAKCKTVLAVLLALAVAGTGAGVLTRQVVRESVPAQAGASAAAPQPQEANRKLAPLLTARLTGVK